MEDLEYCPNDGYLLIKDEIGRLYCPVCGLGWGFSELEENIILGYN